MKIYFRYSDIDSFTTLLTNVYEVFNEFKVHINTKKNVLIVETKDLIPKEIRQFFEPVEAESNSDYKITNFYYPFTDDLEQIKKLLSREKKE